MITLNSLIFTIACFVFCCRWFYILTEMQLKVLTLTNKTICFPYLIWYLFNSNKTNLYLPLSFKIRFVALICFLDWNLLPTWMSLPWNFLILKQPFDIKEVWHAILLEASSTALSSDEINFGAFSHHQGCNMFPFHSASLK